MPTEREAVVNKALSGLELKELILRDVRKLLDADGMLTAISAYSRVAYSFRLRMHLDNLMQRETISHGASAPQPGNAIAQNPQLAAVEGAPPLRDASFDSAVSGVELTRTITSPNAERLNAGMPITVDAREQDGSKVQRSVSYPVPEAGEVPEDVKVDDVTAQTRKDWDMQPVVPNVPAAPMPATKPATPPPPAKPKGK
jgi:hypothetical protein